MTKRLVILTTHFGTNFSGGSTATCEIFSRIESHFDQVVVIGTELGEHTFHSLDFHRYGNWWHAVMLIKKHSSSDTVFYGDFYNSFLFILARVHFYFTYHDNWPELGQTSLTNWMRSLFYTNIYNHIFKKADHLFSVTDCKMSYMSLFSNSISLVRNGFNRVKSDSDVKKNHILMVGNIDKRKYEKALDLFRKVEELSIEIRIDIYGKINDTSLANKLSQFSFVNIVGFRSTVPYGQYQLLLHTSVMENLPIVFCEAIYNRIPVLSFDVGGVGEVINESTGKLVAPFDINSMAEMLKDRLSLWPVSMDFGVPDEFSWEFASNIYLRQMIKAQN